MPVIPKDPLDWLALFRQQINEIFNFLSTLEGRENLGEHEYIPLLDIYETADTFVVEFELPGFGKSDLALNICCNTLVVEGIKREEAGKGGTNFIRMERHFGSFCKTVEIPPAFNARGVRAKYLRGVLSVTFPRSKDNSVVLRDIPIEQGDGDGK